VDQDLLFYEYTTPSSSNPFSNFFSRFLPKTKKKFKTNRIEGIVYKEIKKALVILRRKNKIDFLPKKKKISPIDLKNKNYVDLNSNPPTEALLKCISIIKCIKLVG
jgi:predicted nucleotidyltransferase